MQNNQENKLLLIKDLGQMYVGKSTKHKSYFGIYKCYCGNEFKSQHRYILNGNTKSCGCYKIKRTSESSTKHGLGKHRLNSIWDGIIQRCTNSNRIAFKDYGAIGITICDEWKHDFLSFYNWALENGYQDDLTIDRINPYGNYEPSNCRWANRTTQNRNKKLNPNANKTGFRGISKHGNKYRATISIDYKQIHLGLFTLIEDAVSARDKYIIDNNLEHTMSNA